MRSASVDFPWSMWAMIEKLRMCAWSAMSATTQDRPPAAAPVVAADGGAGRKGVSGTRRQAVVVGGRSPARRGRWSYAPGRRLVAGGRRPSDDGADLHADTPGAHPRVGRLSD